jgi:hypothetical protein
MLGTLIKLAILAIVILVALNILAPKQADKVLDTVSEKTSIDKTTLKENLDKATQFTKDTVKEAATTAKKKFR